MAVRPHLVFHLAIVGLLCVSAQPVAQLKLRPAPSLAAQPAAQLEVRTTAPAYLSYAEAKPVFDAFGEPMSSAAEWASWIAASDRDTRARVAEGDETSIVHWFLFGTSFTRAPRVTSQQLDAGDVEGILNARLGDFERALASAGTSERAQFARQILGTGATIRPRLLAMLDRVMKEGVTHARLIDEARVLGDSRLEFAERSRMYRERGLSSDTSVRVNFAIEEALKGLAPVLSRGADPPIRRVALVGPGLDFSDKQEGYDFYAPQTIQPFAIQDALIRLGLARAGSLEVATFDVSPRVNAHVRSAVRRASGGAAYTIHFPIDGAIRWTRDFLEYWQRIGVPTIGGQTPVTIPPGLGKLRIRAINVRPEFVAAMTPYDLNITAQHLERNDAERFDLIVGTNVFLYYDRLQQGLAMVSASKMLKPGGVLLSNNALVEVPSVGLTSIGYSKTLYSDRDEDGDLIVWYQKAPQ